MAAVISFALPHRLRALTATTSAARRSFATTVSPRSSSSQFHRSDFTSQPFTGSYEPGQPTSGPLGSASTYGVPRMTPRVLKQHLDQFVVGQDRGKKVLSVAVYNHYQRIQDLQRREEEEEELMARRIRSEGTERHPVEGMHSSSREVPWRDQQLSLADEFPGQQSTIRLGDPSDGVDPALGAPPILDPSPLSLEKSNILMLGPSGVGKTLMAKTLARVLSVPFSMSDCTPFTQAGYIGEDAEVCVHRLLAAANYDVARAERGIICLDEIDKIATAKVSHGKDVSGEGVQQALLKIVEGTTVQVQAKPERNAPRAGGQSNTYPTNSPLGGTYPPPSSGSGSGSTASKGEVYNVRTDNILFICTGAFIGLPKIILDRISRGSIGFGQPVRNRSFFTGSSTDSESRSYFSSPIPIAPGSEEEALYKKHLPFFSSGSDPSGEPTYFNPLDLLTPADLQTFGFIPELIGRIPVSTALAPLTHQLLLRILTEPRNSLIAQYTSLFSLSGIELRFTTPALHQVASRALAMGTGARALRTEMETILGDAMYEAPGSSVKHVLVTEKVAERRERAVYLGRGQGAKFHALIAHEEGEWETMVRERTGDDTGRAAAGSFEEWRGKASVSAQGGAS